MKPFRIPARKKNPPNYFNNLPSPRAELLVAPNISFPKRYERGKWDISSAYVGVV
jgi:hypothetical protein